MRSVVAGRDAILLSSGADDGVGHGWKRHDGLAAPSRSSVLEVSQGVNHAMRLTLYGRADCHLCHEMRAVVDAVAPRRCAFELEEVDVDGDPALVAAYGEEVPVLLRERARRPSSTASTARDAARPARPGGA